MWQFYCLPGRVITEIGYLFPKSGQLWASKRRRESGFAAFLFATIFWVFALPVIAPFVLALALLAIHGVGNVIRTGHSSGPTASDLPSTAGDAAGRRDDDRIARDGDRATLSATAPQRQAAAPVPPPKPRVVFAPTREVVEPVTTATGAATQACSATVTDHCTATGAATQACSATVTDHCIER